MADEGESRVVDPVTGALVGTAAKAAGDASAEASKTTWSLIGRALGPAVDEYGEHLRQKVEAWRLANAEKIATKAATKSDGRSGTVPPRVAYKILDEGTLSDDDVAVEYLSGMLAGSRSPNGRDDRAVAWADMVSRMSSAQIRAHFLLYREWAERLQVAPADVNLGMDTGRTRAELHVDLIEFINVLMLVDATATGFASVLSHSIPGLVRLGLIDGNFQYGSYEPTDAVPFRQTLRARPSVPGLELFAWAAGRPDVTPGTFPTAHLQVETEDGIPRLTNVVLPNLAGQPPRP